MRRHLAMLAILIATALPAGADAPFIPAGKAPDHVVTMEANSFGRKGLRTHTHHGGWTRIGGVENGRGMTRYFGHANSILVSASRDGSGAWSYLDIRRGDDPSPLFSRRHAKTGETRTILGETCHVWTVLRSTSSDLVLLSCVTDDNIELWRAYVGARGEISSATATKIERRAVPLADVRPPMEALSLKAWNESTDQGPAPAGSPGDFEAVLEHAPGTVIASAQ